MKLNYFQLISKAPVYIPNVGGVISPTLQDIADIGGTDVYQYYLSILLMDIESYIASKQRPDNLIEIPEEIKSQIDIFEVLMSNDENIMLLQNILNFFIKEDVVYSTNDKVFEIKSDILIKKKRQFR